MKLLISERAMNDLACIYAWHALAQGETAAERFKTRAEEALALLLKHPEAGPHPAWATLHLDLRFWIISRTRYLLFYEVHPGQISIARVLDGRRDVRRIMEQGQEQPPSGI